MRILVHGHKGKMRSLSCKAISEDSHLELVGQSDENDSLSKKIEKERPQVVLDFTSSANVINNIKTIISYEVHPVVSTNRFSHQQINLLTKLCRIKKLGCLIVPNFSIAHNLMVRYCKNINKYFKNSMLINICDERAVEKKLVQANKTIECLDFDQHYPNNIDSECLPTFTYHKKVVFSSTSEIFTIKVSSISRNSFIPGICFSCKIVGSLNGLVYGLDNLL